jgi:aspartate beta-hydroxylase
VLLDYGLYSQRAGPAVSAPHRGIALANRPHWRLPLTESQFQPTTSDFLARFQQALAVRDFEQAEHFGEIISVREPGIEDVTAFLIARALSRQDILRALNIGRGAVQARPDNARLHFHLGTALEASGNREAALAAFRKARECDPELMVAALWQADQELALGRDDDALRSQLQALSVAERNGQLAPGTTLIPPVRLRVERAVASVQKVRQSWITAALAPLRAEFGDSALSRIDQALARIYGQPFAVPSNPLQQPSLLWLPGLPDQPWFERGQFPFLQTIEQATAQIRAELLGVLANEEELSPYVDMPANAPAAAIWRGLNRSPDWSAYHLVRHGERIAAHCERCPRTIALLESLPIMRIPEHSPEILFSVLRPKTRIPPHTGVINGRLTVHLPLIVPEDCGALRAGEEARSWKVGECLVFDDSFVHEAWNDSDQTRVVLIFDIWNPHLTEAERNALSTAIAGLGDFRRRYGAQDITHEAG